MPAHPKLSYNDWADARARWESDPRQGYSWLVTDMTLPVSGAAVRNKATRERWRKKSEAHSKTSAKSSELPPCRGCCYENHAHLDKTSLHNRCCSQLAPLNQLLGTIETLEESIRRLKESITNHNKP